MDGPYTCHLTGLLMYLKLKLYWLEYWLKYSCENILIRSDIKIQISDRSVMQDCILTQLFTNVKLQNLRAPKPDAVYCVAADAYELGVELCVR